MFEAATQILIYKIVLTTVILLFCIGKAFTKETRSGSIMPFLLSLFCILFIGWREWKADEFVDSIRYGYSYLYNYQTLDPSDIKDLSFGIFSYLCYALGIHVDLYFVLCTCLYILPLLLVVKRIDDTRKTFFFLMIIASMSFFDYGVNIVRNGIASSFLLLSFVYSKRLAVALPITILAIGFHKSLLLPALIFIAVNYYNKPKLFLCFWLLSIPASFVISSIFQEYILQFNFISDRMGQYAEGAADNDLFSRTGFRWDFLIYGAIPIVIGYYYTLRRKLEDNLYTLLLSTYTLTNAIWVIINEIQYSNRFAYLSWFLMPILILYPIVKFENKRKQALTLFLYYTITMILW